MTPDRNNDPDWLLKAMLEAVRAVLHHGHAGDADTVLTAMVWLDLMLQAFAAELGQDPEHW